VASRLALGILASGSGSNLQAILDAIREGRLSAEARVVVCNRPGAGAIARAEADGVPVDLVDHRAVASREAFDARLVEILRARGVELVCLAGFDRLITPVFVEAFRDRILNVHPALLPSFKGLHGQRQALEYGAKIAGCTVHFVDEQTDHGPIVIQAAVPVLEDDDEASLARRILEQEHRIYPEAIRLFAEGRLQIEGRRVRILGAADEPGPALARPRPR
jgi:phosphoribosylglycinamide formyltransferase 1